MARRRRHFGSVRKLPSGRYQARYPGPDGRQHPAPDTFERRRDAELWLAKVEMDLANGEWIDPDAGRVKFETYAWSWLNEHQLSDTTWERYEVVLRLHILPTFGNYALIDIREQGVRRWRKELLDAGVGEPTVAKSYRVLRAILNTAVDDGLIRRNPCRIKGARDDKSSERPVIEIDQVFAIAEAMGGWFRAAVLLAKFTSLRFGELVALRRRDVDLEAGFVRVVRAQTETRRAGLGVKDPKTEAGKRVVAIPEAVLPELRAHVEWFAEQGPDGLIFVGPKGGRLRRHNFRKLWIKACRSVGIPEELDLHFHDLRHTGNTLAAGTGASVKELMARMGHASPRAALIYQHATSNRDQMIAAAMNAEIAAARRGPSTESPGSAESLANGTQMAREEGA